MESKSNTKLSILERLTGWLILCGDLANTMALIFAVIVISLLTWTWPDSSHH